MKKLSLILSIIAIGFTGSVSADIQAPPGASYTPTRKLSRGLSNILYGFMEIPEQIVRKNRAYGSKGGSMNGVVDGTKRTFRRLGYGFYELVTFYCPTYRGTFKQPYRSCGKENRMAFDISEGLSEFPPELGAGSSRYRYSRSQGF